MKENKPLIAAYGFTDADDHAIPIFTTEVESYKGKMYRTLEKASIAIKRRKQDGKLSEENAVHDGIA